MNQDGSSFQNSNSEFQKEFLSKDESLLSSKDKFSINKLLLFSFLGLVFSFFIGLPSLIYAIQTLKKVVPQFKHLNSYSVPTLKKLRLVRNFSILSILFSSLFFIFYVLALISRGYFNWF